MSVLLNEWWLRLSASWCLSARCGGDAGSSAEQPQVIAPVACGCRVEVDPPSLIKARPAPFRPFPNYGYRFESRCCTSNSRPPFRRS